MDIIAVVIEDRPHTCSHIHKNSTKVIFITDNKLINLIFCHRKYLNSLEYDELHHRSASWAKISTGNFQKLPNPSNSHLHNL